MNTTWKNTISTYLLIAEPSNESASIDQCVVAACPEERKRRIETKSIDS